MSSEAATVGLDHLMDTSIPHFDCTVDPKNVKETAHKILASLRKDWDINKVVIKRCGIGFVNNVMTLCEEDKNDKIILRIYGTVFEEILDKQQEISCTMLLSELGISPKLLGTFTNGLCFQFIRGLIFDWKDFSSLNDIRIAKSFVRELASFHCNSTRKLAINKYNINPDEIFINKHFDNLLKIYPTREQFLDGEAHDLFVMKSLTKDEVRAEVELMKKMVRDMQLPVVFCHNDANPSNSIYASDADKCTIVDYDLTGFGNAEFDLAFFLKFMCFDLFDTPDPLSPRCQPGYREEVILEYLATRCTLDGTDARPAHQNDIHFQRLYVRVQKMYLVVSLVFYIYCLIDATLKELNHGTPIQYLRKAFESFDNDYKACKEHLMGLAVPDIIDYGHCSNAWNTV